MAAAPSGLMFALTPNLQRGIKLINDLDVAKFPRVLTRVVQKLHLKAEAPFNDQEFAQLQELLHISGEDLHDALVTCSFLLQQAAYFGVKAKRFGAQLIKADMTQEKAEVFFQLWEKHGETVVAKLQEQSIAPLELASVDWRLSINMSQDDATRLKGMSTMFQFNLRDNANDKAPLQKLQVEMSQSELVTFYNQLETIQQQLDAVQQR